MGATLTRQSGLMAEMRIVANNIANANTTGFRAEDVTFSECVQDLGRDAPSLSMAAARVRETDFIQGAIERTNAPFDFAIEGEGFFLVATPAGERLTRAGSFTANENGDLVTAEGHAVLDPGGAPVFVPFGAGQIAVAADGTISAGGDPVGQIGIVMPADPTRLVREDGVRFRAEDGWLPATNARVLQGHLEQSNVDPVLQIARMIEVQRAYELGQSFLQREDERIRGMIQSITR